MKNMTKDDVIKRFVNSAIKPIVKLETLDKPLVENELSLEKKWTVIVPGRPFTNSATRHNLQMNLSYNPHKANMIKVARKIYELDENAKLNDVCILSPMIVHLTAYFAFSNKEYKIMEKKYTKQVLERVGKETLFSLFLKDLDNMCKVSYDTFQDSEFRVILKDDYIVKAVTQKLATDDVSKERLQMEIYFTEKGHWSYNKIRKTKEYLSYTLSLKYKFLNQISDNDWYIRFMKNINSFVNNTKDYNIDKTIRRSLDDYTFKELSLFFPNFTNKDKIKKEKVIEDIIDYIYKNIITYNKNKTK